LKKVSPPAEAGIPPELDPSLATAQKESSEVASFTESVIS
jgi:hypothetical protein